MIFNAIANLLLLVAGTAVGVIWIKSLIEWDGKVRCDKNQCKYCPYSGSCEYENQTEQNQEDEQ